MNLIRLKCPACKASLPFKKALLLPDSDTIKCSVCSVTLSPDNKRIGAIGGTGAVIGYLMYVNFGLLATVVYLVMLFPVCFMFSRFKVVDVERT